MLLRRSILPLSFALLFLLLIFPGDDLHGQPVNLDDYVHTPLKPNKAAAYFHYVLSKLAEKEGNQPRSEEELKRAMELDPQSSLLRSETAEIRLRSGKVDEAMELCKQAIALDRQNPDAHFFLANIYLFLSEQKSPKATQADAINEFLEVIRIHPKKGLALLKLGQIYLQKQQPDKAIEYLEQGIDTPESSDEFHFLLAQAYQMKGNLKEAVDAALRSVQMNPSSRNMESLEKLLAESGQAKEAVEIYKSVLAVDSENIEIKKRLASLLLNNDQFEESTRLFQEILADDAEDLQTMLQLSRSLSGQHKFQEAHDILTSALQLDPTNVATRYYLALTQAQMGKLEQAMAGFRKLLQDTFKANGKYNPQEFEERLVFQRHLALLLQEAGENEKALGEFQSLLETQENADHYRLLANALRVAKNYKDALALLDKGVAKYPQDKYMKYLKAQILIESEKNWEKGEKYLRSELGRIPEDQEYYVTLGQIYVEGKQFRKAEELILSALKKFSDDPLLRFQLGVIYERSKKLIKAEEVFLQIIKENPKHASALNYLGYMWADQGVRLNESLDFIQKAVDLDPGNAAYLDSLGWVFFRLNRLSEAEKYLSTAAKRVKNDSTIHDHLGDLYFRLGDYSKAESSWRQALLHGTESEELDRIQKKLKQLKNTGNPKH